MKYSIKIFIESGFPDSIRGVCHYEKSKDEYWIFLSDTLTAAERERTIAHELFHVINGDLHSGADVEEVEQRAHAFTASLYSAPEGRTRHGKTLNL